MNDFALHTLPPEKFPMVIHAFGPDGHEVWRHIIEPNQIVQIPGTGPGSVRYLVLHFGDDTSVLFDDPTMAGTA